MAPEPSAVELAFELSEGRRAFVRMTDRRDGDFAVVQPAEVVDTRRRAIVDAPWTWFHQVHGAAVVAVDHAGAGAGQEADAAFTAVAGAPLAVHVADCAPVALIADTAVGVAHAGWRGLVAGVIGELAAAMRAAGHHPNRAVCGPCIGADRYEFGAADLDTVADVFGSSVRSVTATGRPALDVRAAVRAAVAAAGVDELGEIAGCTATDADRYWSHRARADPERQAMVVWMEAP